MPCTCIYRPGWQGAATAAAVPLLCPGGDSKTLMVVQVAPVEKNSAETVCSLNFAQRVRAVELGPAARSVERVRDQQVRGRD